MTAAVSKGHAKAVEAAIDYMRQNLGAEVNLDGVAAVMRYSKYHSARIFAKQTGQTPGRYLAVLRMEHAAKLVADGAKNMADVSNMVGYTSVGTFSNTFSAYWGAPPTLFVISRCPCGLFDGRSHTPSGYCRARSGERCIRCHSCLAGIPAEGSWTWGVRSAITSLVLICKDERQARRMRYGQNELVRRRRGADPWQTVEVN